MHLADRLPPIEDLIPHRGTMLLLDRVTAFSPEMAVAEYMPRRQAWYVDVNGNMPAWIGIELMAQAIAAHVALMKRRDGLPAKMGVLLGTRSFRSVPPWFDAGSLLQIRADMVLLDPGGLGAYDCRIMHEGQTLATSTLKVYEPENFEIFMQGNA